jgi:hypothetical protein
MSTHAPPAGWASRWGDLRELLSDVVVERLRPETPCSVTRSTDR